MLLKRGQITIFIIISILIIAIVALFFMFRGGIGKKESVAPEIAPIQNFVQKCLDESLEKVVFQVGENGGYYFLGNIPRTPVLEIPYYIKNNQNLMPSREKIEGEISRGIKKELILCIGDFSEFAEYEITKGTLKPPIVKIEPERVLVDLEYPLTIVKGETKSKIENFDSEILVRLGIIYDAIEEFVSEDIKTGGLCIDCLFVFERANIKSTATPYGENIDIIIIEDTLSEINKRKFLYIFADEK